MLVGFIYNNETYYYIRTLTGEITKIVNSAKEVVGEYIYDAYGNILNLDALSEIAEINPYRYKGYYYDQETNLYYCKSRYYSPEIYRWLSRDAIEYLDTSSITGCNLYAYCHNNPVMYMDENGGFALKVFFTKIVTTLGATLLAVAITAITLIDIELTAEANDAKHDYDSNTISHDLSSENVIIDNGVIAKNYEIDGNLHSEVLGTYSDGNYHINNSYTYNSDDMVVLCNLIANHMGDENESSRLYNEWYEHNLSYYAFSNNGLFGIINSKYEDYSGTNIADAARSIDFGIQKETGKRLMVLKGVRFYSSRPHPKRYFIFV